MKQLLSALLIIFSLNILFSQNTTIQQWYLQYIVKDGVIHPNYYNEEQIMDLVFIETDQSPNNYAYTAISSCNTLLGTFNTGIDFPSSPSTITFTETNITLVDCGASTPRVQYENLFLEVFTHNNSEILLPFSYEITTVEDDTDRTNINSSPPPPPKLTLTNSFGDKLVYYLTPPYGILVETWYLSRIEIPGNSNIQIPLGDNPSITFTNEINPITYRTTAFGEGECNAFMSDYEITLNNGNNIQLLDFSPTLGFCESYYETEYFSTIGFQPNNFSEFEITTNGTVLTLTDLLGAKLVFGDQPLSISENNFNTLNIALKSNPVSDKIDLILNFNNSKLNYQIYSIDGKLITQAVLQSESINVDYLNSGLYFISFSNDSQQIQTIKLIKQ